MSVSTVAMAKLHKLRFELLPHPLYSPDLTLMTFFYSQISRSGSGERNFRPMRRSSLLWMRILKASRFSTFLKGSKNWNTAGLSV